MQLEVAQLDRKYATIRIEDRARRSQLTAHLLEHGQQSPVVVVPADHAGRYVLIDGYDRVAALESLARDLVEALVFKLTEPEALIISHRVDGARTRSAIEEGWLLRELVEQHGIARRKLVVQLGRSASWISRRLALVEQLPESVQRAVQRGRLSAQVATKYLVPLARANAVQCERLVERLAGQGVSVRQMQRLYMAWRDGDDEQRERVVDHPQLFLQATSEHSADPMQGPVMILNRDLRMLGAVASRAERRLDEHVYRDASARERGRLERSMRAATSRVAVLSDRFDQECQDAGSGHAHSGPSTAR